MRTTKKTLLLASLFVLGCAASPTLRESTDDLNPADRDPTADPGSDFYRFANGGWLDRNPCPDDYSSWGVAQELNERNQEILRTLLEDAAGSRGGADSLEGKLGDFYASGMDTRRIESEGVAPLKPHFDRIERLQRPGQLPALLAHLHRIGAGPIFSLGSEADFEDATRVVAWVVEGGLGLPDRDYYLRQDDESEALRGQYVKHVARMLELLGDERRTAVARAAEILAFETRLAAKSLTAVEQRDPQKLARKVTFREAQASTPNFDWTAYLRAVGASEPKSLNQPNEAFFKEFDAMIFEVPFEQWRQYLRWHLLTAMAPRLSSDFEQEDFRFYSQTLEGTPRMQPRWRRVLNATNAAMGEGLGRLYVARTFPPQAKQRAERMVADLLAVMRTRLGTVEWMSEDTRRQALLKLESFGTKIGYPDEWRDWSGLETARDSYVLNSIRANQFDFDWQLSKIGQPVDPHEWGMAPQTVNAYYHPLRNEIVFPAGILQPPFFDEQADDALNYGAMGAVIGHEITHGFDDSGAQFDAEGKLRNWWSPEDLEEFESRAKVLVDQFYGYYVADGLAVNGELTLGENIADLGGLSIAFEALQRRSAGTPDPMAGDLSREQRFFLAWARAWRQNARDEFLELMVHTNPHAPAQFRAIGAPSNMPEFARAFGLEEGQPMVRPEAERAKIW